MIPHALQVIVLVWTKAVGVAALATVERAAAAAAAAAMVPAGGSRAWCRAHTYRPIKHLLRLSLGTNFFW